MNQTASASGASLLPDTTDLFTATHLVLIAVLAILVISGIVFGARLSRRRRQARAELEEHNEQVEQQPPPPAATPPLPAPAPEARHAAPAAPSPRRPEPSPAPPSGPSPAVAQLRPESPRAATPVEPVQPTGPSPADGPVTQLKGLGPKVATRLGELGVTSVGRMAALTDDEAQALDAQLGPFMGRMGRDRWQEQARFLAAGDVKGFEAVFGRL